MTTENETAVETDCLEITVTLLVQTRIPASEVQEAYGTTEAPEICDQEVATLLRDGPEAYIKDASNVEVLSAVGTWRT